MKKRFTEEQIIGVLKEGEAGLPVKEICRRKYPLSDMPQSPNALHDCAIHDSITSPVLASRGHRTYRVP